eukprot:1159965-Pelagomonas_calceolata.AAC.22
MEEEQENRYSRHIVMELRKLEQHMPMTEGHRPAKEHARRKWNEHCYDMSKAGTLKGSSL